MRTISALFDSYSHAASAVRELKDAGVPSEDIALVAKTPDGLIHEEGHTHSMINAPKAVGLGAATGAGVGLLAGLGALAIPGIGPVVAGGWLLSTAIGAALGATSGGILGALLKAGVSEEDAHVYAEGVRRGGALVTARVDQALADSANGMLQRSQGVDINARREEYATEGWQRFDETSEPYVRTPETIPPVGIDRM